LGPATWFSPSSASFPLITTSPLTNHTTGARLGWFLKVTVAFERIVTLEYLKTTAHFSGS
jgi:hypothetical protein